ncbi:heparan-alpha-glucosaminide N-acetyltransferase-like isoform X2 [Diorhabda carinulata]|uniref:heparan-alpha-glucosaminide N-acetyltransferase-like isoform X2 n=1 Tax=Diorhabda carinulata TaxID=1163345 RepID=UPI0025A18FAA|nr:heparan-alpha-glucosaminide N-acetyltransferase-like isoform X2 [Diorhabda carinulata]
MLFDDINKCLDSQPNLTYDEACLDIQNTLNVVVQILYQYDECYKCDPQTLTTLEPYKNTSVPTKTSSPIQIIRIDSTNITCRYHQLLYEHYRYGLNITNKCSEIYIKEPADDAYLPILMAFVILFSFGTFWYMVKCIYKNSGRVRQILTWNTEMEEDLIGSSAGTPIIFERPPTALAKHPNRLKSIDTFRGLCIAVMIFVNYGGGKYSFFRHSIWNGLTIADLVFPWFIWLMGFSMTMSMQHKLRALVPRRLMVFQVIRRSLIFILLGVLLNSNKNMSTIAALRFPGVLQRIGLVYLLIGILEIVLIKRSQTETSSWASDLTSSWIQWTVVSCLILIHTCITFLAEVPNCGKGYLGPGGLEDGGHHYNCTGGVAGYIDRSVFGNHMYQNFETQRVYENILRFDPEGILSTFTSILTAYFGVQAGKILIIYEGVRGKLIRWLIWGFIFALLGGILCSFSINEGSIPLNKKLWSLSYTFVTAGMAFIIEAGLYLFVDVLKKWGGRPLFYPGMNAIILYVGHELFKNTFPFGWIPTYPTHSTYLFMNLWGTFLWISISIWMYKHNIFFKI